MRDYQLIKNNPWYIENANIRREVRYIIQDYKNLLKQRNKLINGGTELPERGKAILIMTEMKLRAIEETTSEMCSKYADTYTREEFDAYAAFEDYEVFCYYRSNPCKDEAPSKRTWAYYRAEFKWNVAVRMNFI